MNSISWPIPAVCPVKDHKYMTNMTTDRLVRWNGGPTIQ